jgi:hypothetical protein
MTSDVGLPDDFNARLKDAYLGLRGCIASKEATRSY